MTQTKEQKREYNRQRYYKNRQKISKQHREYQKTDKGKKVNNIGRWKSQGILCFDYDLLYELYVKTTHCEFCNCELNKCSKTRKCLDHDHSITDKFNVRGILCISCNIKDVLK